MTTFAKGLLPDPPGHRVSGSHLVLGAPRAPSRKSNSVSGPPIGNQSITSRCTGWGIGRSAQTTLLPTESQWIVSPGGIYTFGRAVDRVDPMTTRLRDDGAEPNQVVRGIVEWGLPKEADWPTLDTNVNAEPTLGQIERAAILRTPNWYGVRETDLTRKIARLVQLIDERIAPAFACFVDDAHEEYTGQGRLSTPEGWEDGSNHMLCMVGYDDYGQTLIWAGSWGTSWGDHGFGRGDAGFLATIDSIYFTRPA